MSEFTQLVDTYTEEFSCMEEYYLGTSYGKVTESQIGYGSAVKMRKTNRYYINSILM
jgi:hypothetical protein